MAGQSARCAIFVSLRDFALANSRLPLMTSLLEQGWRVVAACVPGKSESLLRKKGVEIEPIPFRRGGFSIGDAASVKALRDLYRRSRPTLVHHFNAKPIVYGGLAARGLEGTKVVSTVTGLGYGFAQVGMGRLGAGFGYRLTAPGADAVIFQNVSDREFFIERGWVERSRAWLIISSGVDVSRFREAGRRAGPAGGVLMVGRLLWGKGVKEFVEAAEMLRSRGSRVPFVLGGEVERDHPDRVDPMFIRDAQNEGLLSFCGYIDDMPHALARALVFAAPSYYGEGVARVVLEAAASGRPVVAADTHSSREVIRHEESGLLVPPRDSGALADAIEALLEDPKRREAIGEAAYREVSRRFSLESVTEQQLDVYRQIGALGQG